MNWRTLAHRLLLTLTIVLAQPPFAAAGEARTNHADAPGIAWFDGTVADAFAAAQAANKPVFIYLGAKWCPPCQQLKSLVFSRRDFIDKSQQFVAVYLDGDDPGAQKWGDKFKFVGYPTVLFFRPDQKEIMRVSGGIDLSQYADVLDIALSDVKPFSSVVAKMRKDSAALSHNDCQRLAYNGWDSKDYSAAQSQRLAADLLRASQHCETATAVERARLTAASAAFVPSPQAVTRVIAMVEDPAKRAQVAGAIESLDKRFFKAVLARGDVVAARFLAAWNQTFEEMANDRKIIDADQLAAIYFKLEAIKELTPDHKIPDAAAQSARARVAATVSKKFEPYVRAGVVNSAANIDEQLGDVDAEYALLKGELATATTPYYYMVDLGEIEEKRGHIAESLAWYERGYRESRGIATRFGWGNKYLSALLRMAPSDHERIREVGESVIGELDGPERIQAGARARLAKLDKQLREWNAKHQYDADLRALRARLLEICGKLPSADASLGSCRQFLI